jgi:hypothetical protein
MKIPIELTISIGEYENAKPTIEIDTDNLDEAKELVIKLWDAFHGLVKFRPVKNGKTEEEIVNEGLFSGKQMDAETKEELAKTDFKLQGFYDRIRKGEAIPFSEWDSLIKPQQDFLHKAQLLHDAEVRANKKDASAK